MIKILDFYADWCMPCKLLSPILDEIANELDYVQIEKIDVEANPEEADEWKVLNIPTLIMFKDNVFVDKSVGMISKTKLLEKIISYHGK